MVETAKYEVILKEGEFETRRYKEMLLATVKGTSDRFQSLFRYISGSNRSKSKINMTSPVISSEKIAMTSPVLSDDEAMSFVVPSEFSHDTVPEPNDPHVSIEVVPERIVATVRFKGFASKDSVKKETNKLLGWIEMKGYVLKGSPFLMQYNPPFVPGFMRRNEIGIEIEPNNVD
jgi:effector-binding domain-containing protein